MPSDVILVINAGSSSIKLSLFKYIPKAIQSAARRERNRGAECTNRYMSTEISSQQNRTLKGEGYSSLSLTRHTIIESTSKLSCISDWLEPLSKRFTVNAVGHRVTHGGAFFLGPTLITPDALKKMASLNALAPLHQPHNIKAINIMSNLYPKVPQVACFDTTFHQTQHKLAKLFALPRTLTQKGIIRYGFHGISYEYIASVLPRYLPHKSNGKVIVAHLGQGASMCALKEYKSIATTMGLTALDGLMMGTRCGTIDPGVILYLLQEKKFSAKKIENMLYLKSGLLGVSGISSDMRELESNKDHKAKEAVDLFCYYAAKELASLCVSLDGCDAIVFTAGIGENSAIVRKKICNHLNWLGIVLNEKANKNNAAIISSNKSAITVSVIPTNEEYMIAKHVSNLL